MPGEHLHSHSSFTSHSRKGGSNYGMAFGSGRGDCFLFGFRLPAFWAGFGFGFFCSIHMDGGAVWKRTDGQKDGFGQLGWWYRRTADGGPDGDFIIYIPYPYYPYPGPSFSCCCFVVVCVVPCMSAARCLCAASLLPALFAWFHD